MAIASAKIPEREETVRFSMTENSGRLPLILPMYVKQVICGVGKKLALKVFTDMCYG